MSRLIDRSRSVPPYQSDSIPVPSIQSPQQRQLGDQAGPQQRQRAAPRLPLKPLGRLPGQRQRGRSAQGRGAVLAGMYMYVCMCVWSVCRSIEPPLGGFPQSTPPYSFHKGQRFIRQGPLPARRRALPDGPLQRGGAGLRGRAGPGAVQRRDEEGAGRCTQGGGGKPAVERGGAAAPTPRVPRGATPSPPAWPLPAW